MLKFCNEKALAAGSEIDAIWEIKKKHKKTIIIDFDLGFMIFSPCLCYISKEQLIYWKLML
jgi:hypothetical protein